MPEVKFLVLKMRFVPRQFNPSVCAINPYIPPTEVSPEEGRGGGSRDWKSGIIILRAVVTLEVGVGTRDHYLVVYSPSTWIMGL